MRQQSYKYVYNTIACYDAIERDCRRIRRRLHSTWENI